MGGGPPTVLTPDKVSGPASASMYDAVWIPRDGVPLDLAGRIVSILLISYVVLNRLIPDRFVIPVGASVRLYEVVLVFLGIAWAIWIFREPHPFPTGLVGLFGLLMFAIIGLAPFMHALSLNLYQTNAAERGLFRLFIFSTMFLASFHLAFRVREGYRIVAWVIAATAFQALVAVWEFVTQKPVPFLDGFALAIGMIPDPQSIRSGFQGDVFHRLTGEVRSVATAPHPIVLSAVIALGVLVVGTWLLYAKQGRQRRWLIVSGTLLVLALPVTNSRTAFVMVGLAAVPIVVLHIRKLPQILLWSLPMLAAMAVAFAISPETPRLLLNSVTNSGNDQNTNVRIERFSRVPELMEERPFVGAGYLTHDPAIQIFDNAYNKALVELGVVGFAAVILFFIAALAACWRATSRAGEFEIVLPAVGVVAVLALLGAGATFDAWTFDQFFPSAMILLGLGLGRSAVILKREDVVEHLNPNAGAAA